MKKIEQLLLSAIVLLTATTLPSCTDYQDEIDALDYRITILENLVKQVNSEVRALQVAVSAYENSDYITNVTESDEGSIITFKKAGAILVRNGMDGKNGKDGKDAQAPDITVRQGEDGFFYWVVNGEWLMTPDGAPLAASGKDGKDGKDGVDGKDGKDGIDGKDGVDGKDGKDGLNGKDGQNGKDGKDGVDGKDGIDGKDGEDGKDGKDGIDGKDGKDGVNGKDGKDGVDGKDGENGKDGKAPQLRINEETGVWEISTDDGLTWITTGTPVQGKDGKDGKDGEKGKDANGIVEIVTSWNQGYVEFITSAGSFRVPLLIN